MSSDLCRFLDWDSAFFGMRIARVEVTSLTASQVESVLQWSQQNRIRCLYFLSTLDDRVSVKLAEIHQFNLVGIKAVLCWEAGQNTPPPIPPKNPASTRPFQKSDLEELIDIAGHAFQDSRFYLDGHFTTEQASSLYREWIRKSCQGYADRVFVSQSGQGPAGFITCHLDPSATGRIGLVAVKPEARNAGRGRELIEIAKDYFVDRHCRRIEVTTQGHNALAFRMYQKCGFFLESLNLWYHKWFPEGTAENDGLPNPL